MIRRVGLGRCAMAFALMVLIAPDRSLADDQSQDEIQPGDAYADRVHSDGGHGSEHDVAGGLIYEQFVGEKIYIQDQGELYVVIEPEYEKSSDEREFALAGELVIGVTDRLQLEAEVPFVVVDRDGDSQHEGLGDVVLGIRYNFVQEHDFSVGVRSGFIIPSGNENRGLGGGQFVWEPNLLGALRLGEAELYGTVGGEIRAGTGDPNVFNYAIAGAYPWWSLVGVLEFAGSVSTDDNEFYVAPGAFWDVADFLQVGAGVPIGLTRDSDDFQVVGLFVFEFF